MTTDEKPNKKTKKLEWDPSKHNRTIWVNGPSMVAFLDDFVKDKQLGEAGQFGVTFRCKRKEDSRNFAVKHLNKNRFYRIPLQYRHRFLRAMHDEIDILNTLNHRNIISLEKVYEDKATLYIVMEECTGGELFQRIIARGQYSEKDASKVVKQILEALHYMHVTNGIVHCDLKPDNILFATTDEDSLVKIIDFGMSKALPRLQYLTHLCGTPYYTAPEVVAAKKYNHACDIWSVGVILYVMVFGYPPFYVDPDTYGKNERKAIYAKIAKGFTPRVRNTETHGYGPWFPSHIPVSNEVKHLIAKLLAYKVQDRYTAKEALGHPWIVSKNQATKITAGMVESLAKFSNTCQLKVVVVNLFRDQFEKMRPKHFHQLEQVFKEMDGDNDGIVTFEEFAAAVDSVKEINVPQKHIQQMFNELHVGSAEIKGIRFADLLNALVHDYLVAADERLYAAFRELDDDNDGKITTDELKAKLKACDPLGEWDRAIELIAEQTQNEGQIDYEEFLLNLHPNFEESPHWLPAVFKQMTSICPNSTSAKNTNNNTKNNNNNK